MLKNFLQWVNENSQGDSINQLNDLRRLFDLDMIDNKEYLESVIKIANENPEMNVMDQIGDIGPIFNITSTASADYGLEYSEEDDYLVENIEDWLSSWTGPRGERVVMATGTTTDETFHLNIMISTGAKVTFNYDEHETNHDGLLINVNGRKTGLSANQFNEISDAFFYSRDDWETDDWENYMHAVLSGIVETSY
jgi:hypothetical protein